METTSSLANDYFFPSTAIGISPEDIFNARVAITEWNPIAAEISTLLFRPLQWPLLLIHLIYLLLIIISLLAKYLAQTKFRNIGVAINDGPVSEEMLIGNVRSFRRCFPYFDPYSASLTF